MDILAKQRGASGCCLPGRWCQWLSGVTVDATICNALAHRYLDAVRDPAHGDTNGDTAAHGDTNANPHTPSTYGYSQPVSHYHSDDASDGDDDPDDFPLAYGTPLSA